MAKMTIENLRAFAKEYVTAAKSAGTWEGSVDDFTKMVNKIGAQVTLDGAFQDKLAGVFEGEDLPYGKTVEEYFIDLILPLDFKYDKSESESTSYTEDETWTAFLPTFEKAAYSYTLGRKKLPVVVGYDTIQNSVNDASVLANVETMIMKRFADSYTNTRYSIKEQALGNFYSKAADNTTMVETLAKPVDTETGEAFIESIKKEVEIASDRNEGNCLSKELIGAAPSLVLVVKQGVMPSLDVNTLAGAFNLDKLSLGVDVKRVDSFGNDADAAGVYAMLLDPRGVQVRQSYNAVRSDANANKDAVRTVHHYEDTVFTSKYTFGHIYKA